MRVINLQTCLLVCFNASLSYLDKRYFFLIIPRWLLRRLYTRRYKHMNMMFRTMRWYIIIATFILSYHIKVHTVTMNSAVVYIINPIRIAVFSFRDLPSFLGSYYWNRDYIKLFSYTLTSSHRVMLLPKAIFLKKNPRLVKISSAMSILCWLLAYQFTYSVDA